MEEQKQEKEQKKPISFLQSFFEDRNLPEVFSQVDELVTGKTLFTRKQKPNPDSVKKIHSFTDFPSYLNLTASDHIKQYKAKKSDLFDGFLLNLTKYNNIEEYLKGNFGKNGRSKIRRYIKRLDLCIEPIYKMYYGEIDEDEYNRLFDRLRELMMRRFSQKKEENIELPAIEEYRKLLRNLILKKEASLFVIYHGQKPIDICMNFIYGNIMTSYNSSYDIDYETFSLGTVDLYKHVEWCFENGFDIFDLGRGDYIYKRRWTNYKYHFQRLILYDTDSVYHNIVANLKMTYLQFLYDCIQFLKKFGVQHLYGKYYQLHYIFLRKNLHVDLHKAYEINGEQDDFGKVSVKKIDITSSHGQWLVKPINDFIYKTHEKFENVQVLKSLENSRDYYLKGSSQTQKIVILD